MAINVVIAEDEPLSNARLQRFLSNIDEIHHVYSATDGEQALSLINQHQPELLVLDINMPKMTGLEVAMHVSNSSLRSPAIIFTTAYDEFALNAFKVNALAYLMKPIQESELQEAVKRAGQFNRVHVAEINSVDQQSLMLKRSSTIESLKLSEIIYFRATDRLVMAGLASKEENVVSFTLKQLEEKLTPAFFRIHRHTLVNVHFLQSIEKDSDQGKHVVVLRKTEKKFPVSRRQLSTLREIFTKHNI